MKIFEGDKRAQGATEYLLMLAAVLVVVAVAVSMLMGMGPELSASGTIAVSDENNGNNIAIDTTSLNISPSDTNLSAMTLMEGSTQIDQVTWADPGQPVDNLNYTYSITASGTSASDITTIVFEDTDGNTTSMKPVVK